jgi:glycosyltransferase involved in cell wall biosynthesis/CDP-glycerol glycerophosphotransferase (TagB/SpsB family)
MKKFTFAKANAAKLMRLPLYAVAGLLAYVFPRDRELWVFGRKTGVGEGPLRLLRVAAQEYSQLRLVWIAQDSSQYAEAKELGLEVYPKSSWRAHWLTLRAGVGVVTHGFGDLCRPFVPGMYLVQLWHGSPLKRIHLDAPNAQLTGSSGRMGRISARLVALMFKASAAMIHCIPSPSRVVSARFKSAWGWRDLARIRLTGDPRCDVLLEGEPALRRAQAMQLLAEIWGRPTLPAKLILFAPTWRDGEADPTLPHAESLHALNELLARHNAWLVVRSHPWGIAQEDAGRLESGRIRFLSSSMLHDVNRVLNAFDVLITDYSAIAMDYSLLQRPIVFFAPDLEAYQNSRGLYESYDEFSGGEWCADWHAVAGKLASILSDETAAARTAENTGSRLAWRYHSHMDAQSAHRLLHDIAIDLDLARPRKQDAPLEILHITGCLGGVETYLQLLASHNDAQKLKLSFVLPQPCALDEYAGAHDMPVSIVPMQRPIAPWSDFKAAMALRRIIRHSAPDIVHLHSSKAGLVGRLACLGLGRKVVYTPHAYFFLAKQGFARRVFIAAERCLDLVARSITLGTSPSEAQRAIEDVGCPPERVEHILNTVDLEQLIERRTTRTGRHVVLVARVSEQKNIPMYLDMVRRLRDASRVPCYLVGAGHYDDDRRQLLRMMHEAGLAEDDLHVVEWLPRPEVIELLASAAVAVLTSHYESFGYVLAEANCLGVPVVGTDVDGIRDIIRDGWNGYLVPPNDAGAMAARVEKLLHRHEVREVMSAAACDEAAARFDIRKAMPRFEAFYLRLARGR